MKPQPQNTPKTSTRSPGSVNGVHSGKALLQQVVKFTTPIEVLYYLPKLQTLYVYRKVTEQFADCKQMLPKAIL